MLAGIMKIIKEMLRIILRIRIRIIIKLFNLKQYFSGVIRRDGYAFGNQTMT